VTSIRVSITAGGRNGGHHTRAADAPSWTESKSTESRSKAGGRSVVIRRSPYIHDQRPHHMLGIGRLSKFCCRCHRGASKSMDCTILGMECLDIVKIVRNSSHLDHSVPVVGIETLNLGPSVTVSQVMKLSLQFLRTCFETKPGLVWDLIQESLERGVLCEQRRGAAALQTHS
jgi:hypothetical protein